jgi:hypothetical protein
MQGGRGEGKGKVGLGAAAGEKQIPFGDDKQRMREAGSFCFASGQSDGI